MNCVYEQNSLYLQNTFLSVLSGLSMKELSRVSTTSRWFNHLIIKIQYQYAVEIYQQGGKVYQISTTIEKIRNTLFNYILCFEDLPRSIQQDLAPYRMEFIFEGILTKKVLNRDGLLVVVTLKALRPEEKSVSLLGYLLAPWNNTIHYNEQENVFKDCKWIKLKNQEVKVPEHLQGLFDAIEVFKEDEKDKYFLQNFKSMNYFIDRILGRRTMDNEFA